MVYKIITTRARVFIESLVLSVVILIIGFSIGYYLESYRTQGVVADYKEHEVSALDLKLQNYYYQIMDESACSAAINQNFVFADQIYSEGLKLEKYEEANQIRDDLLVEKKRYVLLKDELWLNTILLKNKCKANFDTLVYFYSQDPGSSGIVAQQKIISNILKSIKESRKNSLILIPIAGDLDLGTVNLQRRIYNITYLPSILINEKNLLEGYQSEDKILSYLNKSSVS